MKAKPKKAKKWPHKCLTKCCRGLTWEHSKNSRCPKCSARRWKERNPLRYFFHKLRSRARERGHVFTLSFEEYARLVLASGYLEKRGKTAASLSIDRVEEDKGYVSGNIQVITLSENCRKAWVPYYRQLQEQAEAALEECRRAAEKAESDEPF